MKRIAEAFRHDFVNCGFEIPSADPRKAARLRAAYYRKNRRIARALVAKGFNKFTINMSLRAGLEG